MATRDEDETEAMALWRRTAETMIASGASPAEALDAANVVAQAYEHRRERAAGTSKGTSVADRRASRRTTKRSRQPTNPGHEHARADRGGGDDTARHSVEPPDSVAS